MEDVNQSRDNINQAIKDGTSRIHSEIADQKDMMRDITDDTIKAIDAKMIDEGNEMVVKLQEKYKNAEVTRIEEHEERWDQIKNDMRSVNTQLVTTNSTAIKNTNILEKKLCQAQKIIENQSKMIDDQTRIITALETQTMDIEKRLTQGQTIANKYGTDKIKELIETNIAGDIAEYVKNQAQLHMRPVKEEILAAETRVVQMHEIIENTNIKIKNMNYDTLTSIQDKIYAQNMDIETIFSKLDEISSECEQKEKHVEAIKSSNTPQERTYSKVIFRNNEEHYTKSEEETIDKEKGTTMFMNKDVIDTHKSEHYPPILTPFQFLYPKNNHHAREVESHKFAKAKLVVKCQSEDAIFTFYNALQHILGSYNIL